MNRSEDYVAVSELSRNIPTLRTLWLWAGALELRLELIPDERQEAEAVRDTGSG